MSNGVTILRGDVREIALTLGLESFDGCLCDPPYGLSFMGKRWDYDVPSVETWQAVLAALKPGAHLLAFAGTRTQHRMAVRIEDAGFEIRDMIAWVYGSGFPKSLDVSKAIDKAAGAEREVIGKSARHVSGKPEQRTEGLNGSSTFQESVGMGANMTAPATDAARQWSGYGTALKPALEPITVARKPLIGTVAANCQKYGAGAINVDGCRIEAQGDNLGGGRVSTTTEGWDRPWKHDPVAVAACRARGDAAVATAESLGRWPANLIHDGSEEVTGLFPNSGGSGPSRTLKRGKRDGDDWGMADEPGVLRDAGSGSAARFFYCAKASRSEREAGLDGFGFKEKPGAFDDDAYEWKGKGGHVKASPARNHHPTVKPIALDEYLARLILPPKRDTPRRLLVPFSGSGSEIIGALLAGWDEVVGIELSPEYVEIAEARIAHWTAGQRELAL